MGIDQSLVEEIVRRIVTVAAPQLIIMFGSAAAGTMNRDSDIDLLVVEDRPANPRAESVRLREALRGLGYPFDIIVMSAERFAETRDVIGGIAYPASRHGREIYAAA